MVKITYKVGDKVFAKVKGYPPWPARIESDTGKKKYNVLFYGTKEIGAIKTEDICYYLKNKDSFIQKYTKRAGYVDAVNEIEEAIKIDGGDGSENAGTDEFSVDIEISDAATPSEKKTLKRKASSLPGEALQKKAVGRPRIKSLASTESQEVIESKSDEPAAKKPRRKSTISSENDDIEMESQENIMTVNDKDSIEIEKDVENLHSARNSANTNQENELGKRNNIQKKRKDSESSEKLKEFEVGKIQNNTDDDSFQVEEGLSEHSEKSQRSFSIVTEQMLNNNILYAKHVTDNINLYKDKPVEFREDSKDQVLAVKLESGIFCGLKLHNDWPLKYNSEYDRALYDEKVAKSLFEVKDLLTTGKKLPSEIDDITIIPDLQISDDELNEMTYTKDIESKKKRLDRLKREADLVTWDSKIKNNLGLDKALPEAALNCLKDFHKIEKGLDTLMFKKHPHVLDTIHRLRKYVGNIKKWNLNDEELEDFTKNAEKIRSEAEKIFSKIKNIIRIPEEKGIFWDLFLESVSDFRTQCKDLSETQILVLCAEPDSRQAFLDKLDEVTEPEGAALNTSSNSEPVLKETSVQGWTEKK